MVSIEIQEKSGRWQRCTIVSSNARSIVNALKAAVETNIASGARTARAVDLKTSEVIDFFEMEMNASYETGFNNS